MKTFLYCTACFIFSFYSSLNAESQNPDRYVFGSKVFSYIVSSEQQIEDPFKVRIDYNIPPSQKVQKIMVVIKKAGSILGKVSFSAQGFGSKDITFDKIQGMDDFNLGGYVGKDFQSRSYYFNPFPFNFALLKRKPKENPKNEFGGFYSIKLSQQLSFEKMDLIEVQNEKLENAIPLRIFVKNSLGSMFASSIATIKEEGRLFFYMKMPKKSPQSYHLVSYLGTDFSTKMDGVAPIDLDLVDM